MLLAEFLPSRSAEDILAERVRLSFGGEEFELPALSIAAEEEWRAECAADLGAIYATIDASDSVAAVTARLMRLTPTMLRLIRKYDRYQRLPTDEWITEHASAGGVLKAFIEVFAAANPHIGALLDAAVRHPEMLWEVVRLVRETPSPQPSNGASPNGAGAVPVTSGGR